MYSLDHGVPHVHARYGGDKAAVSIATGEILAGGLPPRAARLMREWVSVRQAELEANWERTMSGQPPLPVEPLP